MGVGVAATWAGSHSHDGVALFTHNDLVLKLIVLKLFSGQESSPHLIP